MKKIIELKTENGKIITAPKSIKNYLLTGKKCQMEYKDTGDDWSPVYFGLVRSDIVGERVLIGKEEFTVPELMSEASHPGRAWNSKLSNVDNVLQAIYDKMSPTDQKLKDKYFRAYYRYYNDGDYLLSASKCKSLTKLGVPEQIIDRLSDRNHEYTSRGHKIPASSKSYEIGLEAAIVAVMQYLLDKYKSILGPKDRHEIYFKQKKEIAKNAIGQGKIDVYWVKKYGKEFGIEELVTLAGEYERTIKSNSSTSSNQIYANEVTAKIKELIKSDLTKHSLQESKIMENKQKSALLTESDVKVINMLKRQFILECAKIGEKPTRKEFDKMLKEIFVSK